MCRPTCVCLLLLCVSNVLSTMPSRSAEYFVAPDGDDTQAGSIDSPFLTVQRAHASVQPGDTVWIRGGNYRLKESQIASNRRGRAYVTLLDKDGDESKPIRFWAYQDEQPVFDFTDVKPNDARVTAFHVTGSWLHLKGLVVTGVQVTILRHTQSICFDNQGSHNVYEQLTMRDGQAIGFWLGRGSHNLVVNCDAFRNHDFTSEGGRGGNVDGFGFHVPRGSIGNTFRGCRAWFNSDDGFDFITTAESVTVENCWAMYNGYDPKFKSLGDGTGFKAGGYAREPASRIPRTVPRHIIRNCMAVGNKASGFYANHQPGGADWIHNSAFKNGINFNMLGRDRVQVNLDVDGYGHFMRNNLGFRGRRELMNLNREKSDVANNYFDLSVEVTKADFASLDEGELTATRQTSGELPQISFMQLVAGSDLIDCGADVGLPFKGKAPDLGAFEFNP
jgi:hypothetical protein